MSVLILFPLGSGFIQSNEGRLSELLQSRAGAAGVDSQNRVMVDRNVCDVFDVVADRKAVYY